MFNRYVANPLRYIANPLLQKKCTGIHELHQYIHTVHQLIHSFLEFHEIDVNDMKNQYQRSSIKTREELFSRIHSHYDRREYETYRLFIKSAVPTLIEQGQIPNPEFLSDAVTARDHMGPQQKPNVPKPIQIDRFITEFLNRDFLPLKDHYVPCEFTLEKLSEEQLQVWLDELLLIAQFARFFRNPRKIIELLQQVILVYAHHQNASAIVSILVRNYDLQQTFLPFHELQTMKYLQDNGIQTERFSLIQLEEEKIKVELIKNKERQDQLVREYEELERIRKLQEEEDARQYLRRQEEDAERIRRAQAEARQRTQDEARQRTQDESRQRAQAEARQRAQDEARQRAQDESRQRAQAEARQRSQARARAQSPVRPPVARQRAQSPVRPRAGSDPTIEDTIREALAWGNRSLHSLKQIDLVENIRPELNNDITEHFNRVFNMNRDDARLIDIDTQIKAEFSRISRNSEEKHRREANEAAQRAHARENDSYVIPRSILELLNQYNIPIPPNPTKSNVTSSLRKIISQNRDNQELVTRVLSLSRNLGIRLRRSKRAKRSSKRAKRSSKRAKRGSKRSKRGSKRSKRM
jgi:hypothetical protein